MFQIDDQINNEKLERFQQAFSIFDKNGDGVITFSDLKLAMSENNQKCTDTEIQDWINEFDIDGDGAINFPEFMSMMAKKKTESLSEEDKKSAFKVFDRDGNWLISVVELKHVMMNLGEKLSQEEVEEMLRQADFDGNGHINYEQFQRLMMFK